MSKKTVALIGGPETGKTNFLARLWESLKSGNGSLRASDIPENISYVEDALNHLLEGEFAPRTRAAGISGTIKISVESRLMEGNGTSELLVPDVMGEIWEKAVSTREISREIHEVLEDACGALLFVRVLSELNETPMDWVVAKKLLELPVKHDSPSGKIPTQVQLCELLKMLEHAWKDSKSARRVAIIVTSWDRLDTRRADDGPHAYISSEFPLFAGKIQSPTNMEICVFGMSVVGGDLTNDLEFKEDFFNQRFQDTGYLVKETPTGNEQSKDITYALDWVLRG